MPSATLTSKGRVTIPAEVRRDMNLAVGDRIDFVEVEPGHYELIAVTRSVCELKGIFGKAKRRVSIRELKAPT